MLLDHHWVHPAQHILISSVLNIQKKYFSCPVSLYEVQDLKWFLTETQVPCGQQRQPWTDSVQKQSLVLYTSCRKGTGSHSKDPLVFHWHWLLEWPGNGQLSASPRVQSKYFGTPKSNFIVSVECTAAFTALPCCAAPNAVPLQQEPRLLTFMNSELKIDSNHIVKEVTYASVF